MGGIYIIYSKSEPDKFYVGRSINISSRIKSHFNMIESGTYHSKSLQDHADTKGIDDLEYKVLHETDSLVKQKEIEGQYLKQNPYFNQSTNPNGGRRPNPYNDITHDDILNKNQNFDLLKEGLSKRDFRAMLVAIKFAYGNPENHNGESCKYARSYLKQV